MAGDVEEFIQNRNLRRPVLIGHSMGAKVAMTVALRSPSLLGALISVDNAPVDAMLKSDFHKYVEGMKEIEKAGIRKQVEADLILTKYEDALAIRQFLLTNLVKIPGTNSLRLRIPIQTLASNIDKMGDFPFKNPDEACYKGPTLFVRGTQSHYVADDVLPVIGQFFPRFVGRDIECGHWVISERPEEFRQAVVSFLKDLEQ
ncbi:MAG: hypothetical protein Q9186_005608 [Xanthomendoza sp. 1 TL-2023]